MVGLWIPLRLGFSPSTGGLPGLLAWVVGGLSMGLVLVVSGTVLSIDEDHVQIDIGFKSEGLVQAWEFMEEDGTMLIQAGDRVDVLLEQSEDRDGRIVLSKEKADKLKIWDEINGAVEKPISSAPNNAPITTSRPVFMPPSACKRILFLRPLSRSA